jgi:hypothetical protein
MQTPCLFTEHVTIYTPVCQATCSIALPHPNHTNHVDWSRTLLSCIRVSQPDFDYPYSVFSWFPSVPPRKYRYITLNWTMAASFHIHINSLSSNCWARTLCSLSEWQFHKINFPSTSQNYTASARLRRNLSLSPSQTALTTTLGFSSGI